MMNLKMKCTAHPANRTKLSLCLTKEHPILNLKPSNNTRIEMLLKQMLK
jgi:hypothetical protein